MLSGWKRLERYAQRVPPGRSPSRSGQSSQFGTWYYTGRIECPDCQFETDEDDPLGLHNCPVSYDSQGNLLEIGDKVVFYANDRIRKGRLTKYKKSTGNYSASLDNPDPDHRQNFTIHRQGRILRDDS